MKNYISLITLLAFVASAFAQVDIDKSINLSGTGPDAKISGIKQVNDPQDAVSVEALQKGGLIYGGTSTFTANVYNITVNPALTTTYLEGMAFTFKADAPNTGAASIKVGAWASVLIKKNISADLAANDIVAGQITTVVYDGVFFQLNSRANQTYLTGNQNIALSGDVSGSGATAISTTIAAGAVNSSKIADNSITDADINSAAAIMRGKLANGTANQVVINDGSGGLSSEALLALSRGGTNNNTYTSAKFLVYDGSKLASTVYDQSSFATAASVSGTTNYVSKFTSGTAVGNSTIFDDGSKVGIGINVPTAQLHVFGGAHPQIKIEKAGGHAIMDIMGSGANFEEGFRFFHGGINQYEVYTINGDSKLRFYTGSADRIVFDNAGNVGIGTTSPGQKLDVQGGYGRFSNVVGTDNNTKAFIEGNATASYVGSLGTQRASFGNSENWETLTADGNAVSIGDPTNFPYKLFVNGDIGVSASNEVFARYSTTEAHKGSLGWDHIQLGNNGTNYIIGGRSIAGGSLNFVVNNTNDYKYNGVTPPNGTSAMIISAAANVGIGVSPTAAKLEVAGSIVAGGVNNGAVIFYRNTNPYSIGSTDAVLTVSDRSGSDWGIFSDKTGFDYGFITYVAPAAEYAYAVHNGSDYVARIKGNGGAYFASNVGVGIQPSSANLDVSGPSGSNVALNITPSGYGGSYRTILAAQSGAQGILIFGNNGTNEIRFGNTNAGGAGYFYVNNSVDHTANSNGILAMYMRSNGNVGIRSTTADYALDVAGQTRATSNMTVTTYTNSNAIVEQQNSTYNPALALKNTALGGGCILFGVGNANGVNVANISTPTTYAPCNASGFVVSSDISVKKDVEYLNKTDLETCLDQIRNIQSIRYRYKTESATQLEGMSYRPNLHIGVVAQSLPAEVATSLDENASGEGGKKILGLSLGDLSGLTVAGIKALDGKQQSMETTIKAQQQQIEQLQKNIDELKTIIKGGR